MQHDTTSCPDSQCDSAGVNLRTLRRIINRHRRRHERAEREFRDWKLDWSVSERVMDQQLLRIGNQLTNRLQSHNPMHGDDEDVILEN